MNVVIPKTYVTVFSFTSKQRKANVDNEEHFYIYYWEQCKTNFANEMLGFLVHCYIYMVIKSINTTRETIWQLKSRSLKCYTFQTKNFNPGNMPKEIIQTKRKLYTHIHCKIQW